MDISNQPRNHNYSRPLDVHLSCNHSEITELVEVIFNKYFNTTTPKSIKPYKKHLKIVLFVISKLMMKLVVQGQQLGTLFHFQLEGQISNFS